MGINKPATENERMFATLLLIFIIFFGLDGLFSLVFPEGAAIMHYRMTLSFVVGMAVGVGFFLWSRPNETGVRDKGMDILQRALTEDEMLLIEIIRASDGITQEALRTKTDFSKSKVSVHLLNLEKKGLIKREKTGRTYKVFIGELLK